MYENDFCEYAVKRKIEGAYLVKTIICAIVLVLIAVAAFVFLVPFSGAIALLIIALDVALMWYLSRYTSIEYEYTLSGEYMDFAAIYSMQYRKELLSVELKKNAKKVMPFDGDFGGFNVNRVFDFRSSKAAAHPYILVFDDEGGVKAVVFDATKKIVENMFHQVPSLVERSASLPE